MLDILSAIGGGFPLNRTMYLKGLPVGGELAFFACDGFGFVVWFLGPGVGVSLVGRHLGVGRVPDVVGAVYVIGFCFDGILLLTRPMAASCISIPSERFWIALNIVSLLL